MLKYIKEGKCNILTREDDNTNMLMDIEILRLHKDEVIEIKEEFKEVAVLILCGKLEFQKPIKKIISRPNVFDFLPTALHVSRLENVRIKCLDYCEVLVQKTTNKKLFDYTFYNETTQKDLCSDQLNERDHRLIRTIFDYDSAPYSNMVLGEVITLAGNWSSFLPHSHRQPEVYYYKFDHKNGFGGCFIGDESFIIKNESYACIPGGENHPQCTAPGYRMYYCWMIRHLENDPWNERIIDDKHLHLIGE